MKKTNEVTKTKITKNKIIQIISEEASIIRRKKELYSELEKIHGELEDLKDKGLGRIGLAERAIYIGTQGFQGEKASNPTGFQNDLPVISPFPRISELDTEIKAMISKRAEPSSTELAKENTELKTKLETLHAQLGDYLK